MLKYPHSSLSLHEPTKRDEGPPFALSSMINVMTTVVKYLGQIFAIYVTQISLLDRQKVVTLLQCYIFHYVAKYVCKEIFICCVMVVFWSRLDRSICLLGSKIFGPF
jgi:hypothetical protein